MRSVLLFVCIVLTNVSICQIPTKSGFVFAKDFSKDIALYKAKEFVFKTILGESKNITKFQIDALAASSSGELTSLVYMCPEKNKEGLVLGFYGSYWNDAGVVYQGYSFKNLPKDSAIFLINFVEKTIDEHSKYLSKDVDNNNIYFQLLDMTFLIYANENGIIKLRLFWSGFDSEWDMTAFKRTKKRLLNKLNN